MKLLASFFSGLLAFLFGFWLDNKFIHWVLAQFPASAHEWLGVIKVGLWFVTFGFTLAMSVYLAIIVGGLVSAALSGTGRVKQRRF